MAPPILPAIVLVCDKEAAIFSVPRNDFYTLAAVDPDERFFDLLPPKSYPAATDFFQSIIVSSIALSPPLATGKEDDTHTLYFAGGLLETHEVLIVGTTDEYSLLSLFYREVLTFHTSNLKATVATMQDVERARQERGEDIYRELSRLNNELVNAQRELARKTAELAEEKSANTEENEASSPSSSSAGDAVARDVEEEQMRMKRVIENLPVMVIALDAAWDVVAWNAEAERVTGYRADELITNPHALAILLPSEREREKVLGDLRRMKGDFRDFHCTITCKDGRKRLTRWDSVSTAVPVPGWSLWGMGFDITEQEEVRHNLSNAQFRFDTLVEAIEGVFWLEDVEHRTLLYVNNAVEKVWGFKKEDIYARPTLFLDMIHPDDLSRVLATYERNLKHPTLTDMQYRIIRPSGEIRWLWSRTFPVNDRTLPGKSLVGIADDITETKRIEETMQRYEFLVNTSKDFMALIDESFTIETANLAYCEAFGYSVVGKELPEVWGQIFFTERMRPLLKKCFNGNIVEDEMAATLPIYGDRVFSVSYYPFSPDNNEITHVVSVCRDITERYRISQQMERELQRKQESIEKAQQLQQNLNRHTLPTFPQINLQTLYLPCEELGGDFFDVVRAPDTGNLVIIHADCTGHGIEASMDATLIKTICLNHLDILGKTMATHKFLEYVNVELMKYYHDDKFPTMFVGVLDVERMMMAYSSANGELPYVINEGEVTRLPAPGGFFLGFDESTEYSMKFYHIKENDVLFFASDALYEATTKHDDLFGKTERGLEYVLRRFGRGIRYDLQTLFTVMQEEEVWLPLTDDLSIILLEHAPPRTFAFRVSSSEELEGVRIEIENTLRYCGYSEQDVYDVTLSLMELGLNGIEHGNNRDPKKSVSIEGTIDCENVRFAIEDEGAGFDPATLPDPTDYERLRRLLDENDVRFARGRGVWIARHLLSSIHYNDKGNRVTFTKHRSSGKTIFGYDELEEALL